MPIYEYVCDNCGHELEAFQKLSESPLVSCPGCQQDKLRKKVSAAGFRLKGGGWYETDFKSGKKKNVSAGEGGSSDGDSKSTDGASKPTDGGTSATSKESSGKSTGGDGGSSASNASSSKSSD